MLLVLLLVAVGLIGLLFYKGRVINTVGLADPKSWHAQPTPPALPPADAQPPSSSQPLPSQPPSSQPPLY